MAKGENQDAVTYFQQALQIREKLGVPGDIADSLHNLGEVYVNLGQYDEAMNSYMKALDLNRKNSDAHGAALQSHSLGVLFQLQGRIGPAVSALQDAVTGLQQSGDHARPLADSLNDLADALARAGRGKESTAPLQEAQTIAHDLKSDALNASLLLTQGDVAFYTGDVKGASSFYDQALRASSHVSEADLAMLAKLDSGKAAIADGRAGAAISNLRAVAQQADQQGRSYISLDAAVAIAEGMIRQKDYAHARQELDRDLARSEKLGTRLLSAKIHYLIGETFRLTGNPTEAGLQYRQAITILDGIRAEPGAEHIPERFDLQPMYKAASPSPANTN